MQTRNNEQKNLNVFEGSCSVLDFLNPENNPHTPLVEIPDSLNPYRKQGIRIFAKLMNALPLNNMKSLPAYNMLLNEMNSGKLKGIDTVIENSSGNTVFSLAVIARLMGLHHTKAVCSHQVSLGKLNILRFLGTEVMVNEEPICPDPNDKTSGIYKARMLAEKNNWFNPGQYDNVSNPDAHYKWTGPQIWEQTKGKISILSVGLGTTGSAVGISRFLKERNPDIKVIGVSRAANNPVPGVRTSNLLKEIAFDWKSAIGYEEEIGTIESYKMSMELCRLGLFVGPSSGFALAGLLKHLSKSNPNHKEHIAVFVCPDSPFPYIDEYFQYLDDSCFPKIQNEHLLKGKYSNHTSDSLSMISEISSDEVFNLVFGDTNDVWRRIRDKETIAVKEGYTIVDIREEYEYEEHHVPCAINIPFNKIDGYLSKNKSKLMKGEIVFICRHGNMSRLAAYKAEKLGIKSISVKGGDTEWSRLNLPRIRNEKCILRFNLEHNN